MSLPISTFTFLFTDIEGSTQLWERFPVQMRPVLAAHDFLIRQAIEAQGGQVFKTMGDAFFAVFAQPGAAVEAALKAQRDLAAADWNEVGSVRVRMALHTGEAQARDGDFFGPALNRVARLLAVGHGGQILLSAAAEARVRDSLPSSAGLLALGRCRLRGLTQPEPVFQLLHPDLPGDFPALRSQEVAAGNLPQPLTSFVGRERESAEVMQHLSAARLLTLVASGGAGKTRLALHVAAALAGEYEEGLWLVELASLSDPALMLSAVAAVLGVREEPGAPLERSLIDFLRSRRLLLILDNCEHLIQACASLAWTLLRACPHLCLLATSRQALDVEGETIYRLPPLSLPGSGDEASPHTLPQSDAARLFIERARTVAPDFRVTPANAPAIANLCIRLDGIPLALELAAARVRVLPVDQIVQRLDDRFHLLAGGSRTALPRQQTLKAMIDWSYALLSEPECALLRRASGFSGGWTLPSAQAVCADEGQSEWETLDLLTHLADKSLLAYEEQEGQGRYFLLESIRHYGQDRLRECGEEKATRDRHFRWFLALAERAKTEARDLDADDVLHALSADRENLRAALTWARESGQAEMGLRLIAALWPFWVQKRGGPRAEFSDALTALLAGATERGPLWAEAQCYAGLLAYYRSDYEAARAFLSLGLAAWREWDTPWGINYALNGLGAVAYAQGDLGAARALYKENLAVARTRSAPDIAVALNSLAAVARDQGDFAAARTHCREALHLCQINQDEWIRGWSLYVLGRVAEAEGDLETARARLEESLAARRADNDQNGIAASLTALGCVVCTQGDLLRAQALLQEGIATQKSESAVWEDRRGVADALDAVARLQVAQGQTARAARLWGAAQVMRAKIGASLPPVDRATLDRQQASARLALGEAAFEDACATGRLLSWEQALEEARAM